MRTDVTHPRIFADLYIFGTFSIPLPEANHIRTRHLALRQHLRKYPRPESLGTPLPEAGQMRIGHHSLPQLHVQWTPVHFSLDSSMG